ncbi:MAG: hypothetical protein PHR92_16200 [Lachnospiraceae bacterium]|nr:hypothetical protein [Lachnospiraceae bacterium]
MDIPDGFYENLDHNMEYLHGAGAQHPEMAMKNIRKPLAWLQFSLGMRMLSGRLPGSCASSKRLNGNLASEKYQETACQGKILKL